MLNVADALGWKYPNMQIQTHNGKITNWGSVSVAQPNENEIILIVSEYENHLRSIAYKKLRRREYPSIEDQLDALIEGGQALADIKSQIQTIKTKYPKPEAS